MGRPREPQTLAAIEALRKTRDLNEALGELAAIGHELTKQQLYTISSRYGAEIGRPVGHPGKQSGLLPWRVIQAHKMAKEALLLRTMASLRLGHQVPKWRATWACKYAERLRLEDKVIHYDPMLGFMEVPRRRRRAEVTGDLEAVDKDLIRDPNIEGP